MSAVTLCLLRSAAECLEHFSKKLQQACYTSTCIHAVPDGRAPTKITAEGIQQARRMHVVRDLKLVSSSPAESTPHTGRASGDRFLRNSHLSRKSQKTRLALRLQCRYL